MNAFANVGAKTYIWYGSWTGGVTYASVANIGLATLPRDRLGSVRPETSPLVVGKTTVPSGDDSSFLTCPVEIGSRAKLFINADPGVILVARLSRATPCPGITVLPEAARETGL